MVELIANGEAVFEAKGLSEDAAVLAGPNGLGLFGAEAGSGAKSMC